MYDKWSYSCREQKPKTKALIPLKAFQKWQYGTDFFSCTVDVLPYWQQNKVFISIPQSWREERGSKSRISRRLRLIRSFAEESFVVWLLGVFLNTKIKNFSTLTWWRASMLFVFLTSASLNFYYSEMTNSEDSNER